MRTATCNESLSALKAMLLFGLRHAPTQKLTLRKGHSCGEGQMEYLWCRRSSRCTPHQLADTLHFACTTSRPLSTHKQESMEHGTRSISRKASYVGD